MKVVRGRRQKNIRMPEELNWRLKEAAVKNRRSENDEILYRLEQSFVQEGGGNGQQ
ncbi:Arc family DNA-binding protein [Serratia sp. CY76391]|uniref:Arc family DNA-binding protein n=1 Tax=Serratia sp. CY76391 TaxID=3383681 RepID=UPI003FA0AD35